MLYSNGCVDGTIIHLCIKLCSSLNYTMANAVYSFRVTVIQDVVELVNYGAVTVCSLGLILQGKNYFVFQFQDSISLCVYLAVWWQGDILKSKGSINVAQIIFCFVMQHCELLFHASESIMNITLTNMFCIAEDIFQTQVPPVFHPL